MTGCDVYRPLLPERLDGELGEADAAAIEAHLTACSECRGVAEGLAAVRAGLLALPEHSLPDEALEAILDRTVRARQRQALPRFAPAWPAWAGAAAVLALALLLLRLPLEPAPPGPPSPADVARARSEALSVLSLASGALHRAEKMASDRVLAGKVGAALRRVPIRWAPRPEPRKS